MPAKKTPPRFAVCIQNMGYEASLERNKIYRVIPDSDAAQDGDIRIVDESAEDYLYPSSWFIALEVPKSLENSLLKAS